MVQTYWQAVHQEMRAIQDEEGFVEVEMMLHFEGIMAEAIDRLYLRGQFEEISTVGQQMALL